MEWNAMKKAMKQEFVWLQAALAAAGIALSARADDAAGVMRLSVPSNDAAVVEMPFAPFAAAVPANFLSGPFTGDGGPLSGVAINNKVGMRQYRVFPSGGGYMITN